MKLLLKKRNKWIVQFWTEIACPDRDDCSESLEEVEQVLFTHSEKLALCFGLMSTPSGSPLHIFKNLRICQDCHSAIKIASDVYKREIVVRDRYRFHSFKRGSCSCSDYWWMIFLNSEIEVSFVMEVHPRHHCSFEGYCWFFKLNPLWCCLWH